MNKLKKILVGLSAFALFAAPLSFGVVGAQGQKPIQQGVCGGANDLKLGSNENCSNLEGEDQLNTLITNVINIFSVIVGVVAVIMIIYGGFRYITSGGDSGNVTNAKNTILYALIGLVIVALSQFIVRFVLQQSTTATN